MFVYTRVSCDERVYPFSERLGLFSLPAVLRSVLARGLRRLFFCLCVLLGRMSRCETPMDPDKDDHTLLMSHTHKRLWHLSPVFVYS